VEAAQNNVDSSARHLNDRERHFLIGLGLSSKRLFFSPPNY